MTNAYSINDNLLSRNVSIVFQTTDSDGKIYKFTKTLLNITETASNSDIHAAASAIAKLYQHDEFSVRLITTNILENDTIIETPEETL